MLKKLADPSASMDGSPSTHLWAGLWWDHACKCAEEDWRSLYVVEITRYSMRSFFRDVRIWSRPVNSKMAALLLALIIILDVKTGFLTQPVIGYLPVIGLTSHITWLTSDNCLRRRLATHDDLISRNFLWSQQLPHWEKSCALRDQYTATSL